jgi:hypothetical protein
MLQGSRLSERQRKKLLTMLRHSIVLALVLVAVPSLQVILLGYYLLAWN